MKLFVSVSRNHYVTRPSHRFFAMTLPRNGVWRSSSSIFRITWSTPAIIRACKGRTRNKDISVYHTHNSGDVIRACMHRSYLRRSASGAGRTDDAGIDLSTRENGISTGRCAFWTRFSVGRVIERVQFDLEAVAPILLSSFYWLIPPRLA